MSSRKSTKKRIRAGSGQGITDSWRPSRKIASSQISLHRGFEGKMENLAYLGRLVRKRAVSCAVEINVADGFAFVGQLHPPPQPPVLARQLRHVCRAR